MGFEMSEDVKFWLGMAGWTAGTLVLCALAYKWFACLVGKAVASELVKAGVILVA